MDGHTCGPWSTSPEKIWQAHLLDPSLLPPRCPWLFASLWWHTFDHIQGRRRGKCICERLSIKLRPSLLSGCGKLPIFETVELLWNVLKAALQEIDVCDYLNKVVSFKCCLVWNHKKFVLKAFRCVSSPHRLWYNHKRHRYDTDSTCCGWSTDALDAQPLWHQNSHRWARCFSLAYSLWFRSNTLDIFEN